jgi:hypothetical protein
MKMDNEILDWLVKRAMEEQDNIASKKLNRLQFALASKEKIAENEKEATKSLGKIEFINEFFQEYNKRKRLEEIQKN